MTKGLENLLFDHKIRNISESEQKQKAFESPVMQARSSIGQKPETHHGNIDPITKTLDEALKYRRNSTPRVVQKSELPDLILDEDVGEKFVEMKYDFEQVYQPDIEQISQDKLRISVNSVRGRKLYESQEI